MPRPGAIVPLAGGDKIIYFITGYPALRAVTQNYIKIKLIDNLLSAPGRARQYLPPAQGVYYVVVGL